MHPAPPTHDAPGTVLGTVFRIARFSVHDGPGIRTTVFLKGCPLQCSWCHSPESQPREPQLAVHEERCLRCGTCLLACENGAIAASGDGYATDFGRCRACGACVARCPSGARELVGREIGRGDLIAEIERDVVFFDQSGGGVTFSGGEPLMQPDFLEAMLSACAERRIHAAVDTCGVASRAVVERIAPRASLFLFDLKVIDGRRHRELTGAPVAAVLDNLAYLAQAGRPVRVRFPVVPGLTDDDANVDDIGRTLRSMGLKRIDVLPYHRAGLAKYARIGATSPLPDVALPTGESLARVVSRLEASGLMVHVGG